MTGYTPLEINECPHCGAWTRDEREWRGEPTLRCAPCGIQWLASDEPPYRTLVGDDIHQRLILWSGYQHPRQWADASMGGCDCSWHKRRREEYWAAHPPKPSLGRRIARAVVGG